MCVSNNYVTTFLELWSSVLRQYQAAHYHILVWGFISDPALGWLQSKELNSPYRKPL
jgi:hypothetical protein